MKSLVVTALLVGSTPVASAGAYLGLAVGPSPALSSNVDGVQPSGRAGRLLGGFRLGRISIEAALTGVDLAWPNLSKIDYTSKQLLVAGKYSIPLGDGFEAFGKVGLHHNWISSSADSADGTGYTLGAGFEYNLKLPIASGSVFVDYEYSSVAFESAGWDLSSRQWMLGFTVGI